MREILFRGKRDEIQEWVEGDLLIDSCKDVSIRADHCTLYYDIIPETVGQYTGLTDKNGKKIFEGDIVQSIKLKLKGIIVFDEHCRFMIKDVPEGTTYLISYNCDEIKVIGNIHDNPELLNNEKEVKDLNENKSASFLINRFLKVN